MKVENNYNGFNDDNDGDDCVDDGDTYDHQFIDDDQSIWMIYHNY